jgi:DNA-binding PadR family transcriptional regulator
VLLGLLRDGSALHGYELGVRYRKLTGTEIAPGSIYRDVAALARSGYIERHDGENGGDERRILYVITERGRRLFDRWLRSAHDDDYLVRLPFLPSLTPPERVRFVEAWRTTIAVKNLQAAARCEPGPSPDDGFSPGGVLAEHRLRLLRAESELVDDVGRAFAAPGTVAAPGTEEHRAVG